MYICLRTHTHTHTHINMYIHIFGSFSDIALYLCCVCVCERERERKRERKNVCMCVREIVFLFVRAVCVWPRQISVQTKGHRLGPLLPQHSATSCNRLQHKLGRIWGHTKGRYPPPFRMQRCVTLHYAATRCTMLQHTPRPISGQTKGHRPAPFQQNKLQHAATHTLTDFVEDLRASPSAFSTAPRCNTLQHAATRCNTLQHAATRTSADFGADKRASPSAFFRLSSSVLEPLVCSLACSLVCSGERLRLRPVSRFSSRDSRSLCLSSSLLRVKR